MVVPKRRSLRASWLLACAFLLLVPATYTVADAAPPRTERRTAEGHAALADDLLAAHEQATTSARRTLLRDALTDLGVIAEEVQLMSFIDLCLSRRSAAIRNERQIDFGLEGARYRVRLEAVVDRDFLRAAAAEADLRPGQPPRTQPKNARTIVPGPRPTIALLVHERYEDAMPSPTVEPRLIKWLTLEPGESGFITTDSSMLGDLIRRDQAVIAAAARGNMNSALQLAGTVPVEWLLVVDAEVSSGAVIEGTGALRPRHATVTARLFEAVSGRYIAVGSGSAVVRHIDAGEGGSMALQRATERNIIPELARGINQYLQGNHPLAGRVIVRVVGVADGPEEHDRLLQLLRRDQHVVAPTVEVKERLAGLISFEMRLQQGRALELADRLIRASADRPALQVVEAMPRLVTLAVRECTPPGGDGQGAALIDELVGDYVALLGAKGSEDRLRRNNEELRAQLRQVRDDTQKRDEIRQAARQVEQSVEESHRQLARMIEQQRVAEKRIDELNTSIAQLQAERDRLEHSTEEAAQRRTELAGQIGLQHRELNDLLNSRDALENRRRDLAEAVSGLRRRAQDLAARG